jgi:hypothetical protein
MPKNGFNRKIQRKSKKQYAGSINDEEAQEFTKSLCKIYDFNEMDAPSIRETFNDIPEACTNTKLKNACEMLKILDTGLWEVLLMVLREAHANNNLKGKISELKNKFPEHSKQNDWLSSNLSYDSDDSDNEIMQSFENAEVYYKKYADACKVCSFSSLNEVVNQVSNETDDDEVISNVRTTCAGQQAGRRSRQNRRRSYRRRI